MIREYGAAFLKEQARTVGPVVFAHPILSRYFTAAESARRALLAVGQLHAKSDGGGSMPLMCWSQFAMITKVNELIEQWRALGPIGWAESAHGWTDITGKPITLTPWQRAVLRAWEAHSAETTTLAVSNRQENGQDGAKCNPAVLALAGPAR
jgi:hypothetical protein